MTDRAALFVAERHLQAAVNAIDRHAVEDEGAARCLKFKDWDVQATREFLVSLEMDRAVARASISES